MASIISAERAKPKLLPIHVYFQENFRRLFREISLNGLKYIEDVRRSIWERAYYFIAFSIAFTAGLYMAIYFLHKWRSTPVIVGITPNAFFIQDMPFPAVTFCNMNQAMASKVKDIKVDTPEYAMLRSICFQPYNYSRFANFTPKSEADTLLNFKIKYSQKCRDMILYCKFGPYVEPCTNLFRDVVLDEGICCIFNRLHPLFLFKKPTKLIQSYTSINGRMSLPTNWNLETGYEEPLPKSFYPRKGAGSGASMGLTVLLNADIDEYYCSSTNGAGFKVLLYNPVDTPHIRETGLPIEIGHQTRMPVNVMLIQSVPELRNIEPNKRKCYFSDEKSLDFYKYYTRRSCEVECKTKQLLDTCNCIPYHMAKIQKNASICFINHMNCIEDTLALTQDPQFLKCKEDCWPGCNDITYYPDMFSTPLAKKEFNLQDNVFNNFSKETIAKNLALVHIYYRTNHFRGNTKVPYTQFIDFLSQTGGIMSLMVGFSIISVAEVFYFALMKPFLDMLLKRDPVVLDSKDDEIKRNIVSKDKSHPQVLFKRRQNINKRIMSCAKREPTLARKERY